VKRLSESDYRKEFRSDPQPARDVAHSNAPDGRQQRALEHALDIRKFEIELYWKRSTHFWTLIGASFAAYGVLSAASANPDRRHLVVLVSSMGVVLSMAWYCVNRGSKRWQENWENHVDLLGDDVIGPLYRTVVQRTATSELPSGRPNSLFRTPAAYSVSKINQIVSGFVTIVWVALLGNSILPLNPRLEFDLFVVTILSLTAVAIALILRLGRSDNVDYTFEILQRESKISPVPDPNSTTSP
jgi:hypothetical protein